MSGVRWLYISSEFKVYRIPNPKNHVHKPIKELAGQNVLEILLYYETKERKPSKLLLIEFDRITLDSNGGYKLTDEETNKGLFNFFEFGFATPEDLVKRDAPLALPWAPVIPTTKEKEALYNYLKDKITPFSADAPYIVERKINALKQTHREHIDLVKKAMKLRQSFLR